MPSNALKISQLIDALQGLAKAHGDLDVVLAQPADRTCVAINGANMVVAMELPWQKLPEPALVFGISTERGGRMSNMPGVVYQAEKTVTEWNYSRAEAPEGVDIDVWRRYGAATVGQRRGDKWFVDEGGRRGMVEIAPVGVLAWKQREA